MYHFTAMPYQAKSTFSVERKREEKKGKASLQQQKQRRAVRHSTIGLPSLACVHSSTVYKVLFHSKDFGVGQIIYGAL